VYAAENTTNVTINQTTAPGNTVGTKASLAAGAYLLQGIVVVYNSGTGAPNLSCQFTATSGTLTAPISTT
jgi:hypothetical protein